jgi:hypothetical protein
LLVVVVAVVGLSQLVQLVVAVLVVTRNLLLRTLQGLTLR